MGGQDRHGIDDPLFGIESFAIAMSRATQNPATAGHLKTGHLEGCARSDIRSLKGAMNNLPLILQNRFSALAAHGWSARRIAGSLTLHRETVGRCLRLAKPATVATGLAVPEPAKPAMVAAGSGSLCEPWREQIERFAAEGLSAQRIYQDLAADHGFGGRYNSVKRFVRLVKATVPLPFRRMECEPGAEAQVDFGQGAWVVADGKRRRPHLFRVVLSFLPQGLLRGRLATRHGDVPALLGKRFRHFGGVAKTVVIDNLKAGVLRADWYDPELNPKLASFATHYGTAILPTKPCHPRHKGKVESGVNYAQENAVKGRTFESLGAQNVFLAEWERSVADTRIHGTVRQQVGALFEASERAALQALPPSLFPSFHEARRKVHRDGHVEYAKAYYSVPPEFYGREVWVRAESALVRIFFRSHGADRPARPRRSRPVPHRRRAYPSPQAQRGGARAGHLLQQCQLIGAHSGAWATAMLDQRGVEGLRVLQGLLQLARKHPVAQVERATATAFRQGTWRLAAVRSLIEAGDGQAIQLDFLQEHPLIRSLDHYRLDALFP